MSVLTKSGRVVVAESLTLRDIHIALGLGDGSWTTPPAENANATALINEVGRRTANTIGYVAPDAGGDIVTPSGTYSVSATPTNHLYIAANFDFGDASSSVIREVGVFVGTTFVGGLPPSQEYFVPAEITSPGRLLHLENLAPIFRSPAIRENFEIVISF